MEARRNQKEFPCWYCGRTDGMLQFSTEFDTPVHPTCVRRAVLDDPENYDTVTEARIMARELEIDVTPHWFDKFTLDGIDKDELYEGLRELIIAVERRDLRGADNIIYEWRESALALTCEKIEAAFAGQDYTLVECDCELCTPTD